MSVLRITYEVDGSSMTTEYDIGDLSWQIVPKVRDVTERIIRAAVGPDPVEDA